LHRRSSCSFILFSGVHIHFSHKRAKEEIRSFFLGITLCFGEEGSCISADDSLIGVDAALISADRFSFGVDAALISADRFSFGVDAAFFGVDTALFSAESLSFGADATFFGVDTALFSAESPSFGADTTLFEVNPLFRTNCSSFIRMLPIFGQKNKKFFTHPPFFHFFFRNGS